MSWCFLSYYLLCLPWLLGIELNTRRIGWNYFTQNISRCICWNQFPSVLVGTNSPLFCFSCCISWNRFPAVLIESIFSAKYFPLYWLESISHRIGCNQFPVVLFSRCIGWNRFPAVLIGTNVPPYWLELFPANISRCIG